MDSNVRAGSIPAPATKKYGSVAQWIEQQPSKLWVDGSNPSGITTMNNKILQIILVILTAILVLCIYTEVVHRNSKVETPNIVDSLNYVIKQKDSIISEVTEERDFFELQVDEMSDEMSFKESEISYWGRKYDSTKIELNKLKRR